MFWSIDGAPAIIRALLKNGGTPTSLLAPDTPLRDARDLQIRSQKVHFIAHDGSSVHDLYSVPTTGGSETCLAYAYSVDSYAAGLGATYVQAFAGLHLVDGGACDYGTDVPNIDCFSLIDSGLSVWGVCNADGNGPIGLARFSGVQHEYLVGPGSGVVNAFSHLTHDDLDLFWSLPNVTTSTFLFRKSLLDDNQGPEQIDDLPIPPNQLRGVHAHGDPDGAIYIVRAQSGSLQIVRTPKDSPGLDDTFAVDVANSIVALDDVSIFYWRASLNDTVDLMRLAL